MRWADRHGRSWRASNDHKAQKGYGPRMRWGKRLGSLAKIGLLSLALVAIGGCWSREELNDRTFIAALLVDRTEEGETEVSAVFILPNRLTSGMSGPSSTQKPYTLISRKGRDVAEAIQHMQDDLPRSVTWGQMRIIIIGDRYARSDMKPLFDHLIRAPEFRLRVYMFYYNGIAKNLLQMESIFERFPSEIWREAAHIKRLPPVTLRDLFYSQWNNFSDGYIPELSLHQVKQPTEKKPVHLTGIRGAALIKNAKVIGRFNQRETQGILLIRERIRDLVLTVNLPDGNGLFSARLFDVHPRTNSYRQGDRVIVNVEIEANADLMSIQPRIDLHDPANIRLLEQALNRELQDLAESAFERARRSKADVFQWSEYVEYKYPSLWKAWSDRLRDNLAMNLEARFVPRVQLRSTGISRSSN